MRELGIDIETYSEVDLGKHGLYKYVSHPSFEILLLSYKIDDGPVKTLDFTAGDLDDIPDEFMQAYHSPDFKKTAWNAQFEINCFKQYEGLEPDITQWECTMCKASMLGYPMALDLVAKVMEIAEKKDARGKALIKYFSVPCKPTKSNGGRTRNLPEHDYAKWKQYIEYNIQDVVVEDAIKNQLRFYNIPRREHLIWLLDQKINNTGVMLDVQLVNQALALNKITAERLKNKAIKITGLDNPNSVAKLKQWFKEVENMDIKKLDKQNIKELLKENYNENVKKLLRIRQEMAKTSTKKYLPMQRCASDVDHRARGLLQYCGAGKTWRWSSRLIQIQNLPRNKMSDLHIARDLIKMGEFEGLRLIYDNIPDLMSQLLRTCFVARPGHSFLVSDFSAIEARVVAWFAEEKWRLEVFNGHGKIYEASGAEMFKIPIEEVKGDIRARSKVAELALGYQGSVNALIKMGALEMGIPEEELQPLVDAWRAANPNIKRLWYNVDKAAIMAVQNPCKKISACKCHFLYKHQTLFIQLPSGRVLSYVKPTIKTNRFDKDSISFYGVDQITKKWCRQETYGGKLVENIVQATARDILADAMLRLDEAGFDIVMHIHDEVVIEHPDEGLDGAFHKAEQIMRTPISWCPGLPLGAESFTTKYYTKG